MRRWLKSAWFWPVVGLVLLVVLTRGQIFAALAPLGKFILPATGIFLLFRYVKRRIQRSLMANVSKTLEQFAQAQRQAQQHTHYSSRGTYREPVDDQTIIEICPTCGRQKTAECPDCQ